MAEYEYYVTISLINPKSLNPLLQDVWKLLFNPLDPPILGEGCIWGTPPDPGRINPGPVSGQPEQGDFQTGEHRGIYELSSINYPVIIL